MSPPNCTIRGARLLESNRGKAVERQLVKNNNIWLTAGEVSRMISIEGKYRHGMTSTQVSIFLKRMEAQGYPLEIKKPPYNSAIAKYRWFGENDDSANEEE